VSNTDFIKGVNDEIFIAELKHKPSGFSRLKQQILESLNRNKTRFGIKQVIEGDKENTTEESIERHQLSPEEQAKLLSTFKARLTSEPKDYKRAKGLNFTEIKSALEARSDLMWSLAQTENAGGIVDIRAITDAEFVFCDFAKETDRSRRNLTYSQAKKDAKEMGVDIQSEEEWRALQKLGDFDTKSWVWVQSDDIFDRGLAWLARRTGDKLEIIHSIAAGHRQGEGWRAELRLPKA